MIGLPRDVRELSGVFRSSRALGVVAGIGAASMAGIPLLGGFVAAGVGILFGIPSLRIKGFYLACATLAAQFFADWAFLRIKWFTNYTPSGSVNAPALEILDFDLSSPTANYLVSLVFTVVLALAAKNIVRGHIGRQWMAIRDMDIAAEIIGVRPMYAKLTAFAVAAPGASAQVAPGIPGAGAFPAAPSSGDVAMPCSQVMPRACSRIIRRD